MAATKLSLYNAALRLIGDAPLASLSDATESRRVLDSIYNDALVYCLEQGLWNFATRAVGLNPDLASPPAFAMTYGYAKPEDFVRLKGIWSDSMQSFPLAAYVVEASFILANVSPIYVSYVSKAPTRGLNLALWSLSFQYYVETHLAAEISLRLNNDQKLLAGLRKMELDRLKDAQNKNVMEDGPRFPPIGSWVQARHTGTIGAINSSLRGTLRGL